MIANNEELQAKIQEAKRQQEAHEAKTKPKQQDFGAGVFSIAIELVAGVLVGGFVGYYVDHFLNSSPWGLLIFLLFGAASGFYNVYKSSMKAYQEKK